MKSKTYLSRKLRHYYGKVIFSESLRSQKGQNKPKKASQDSVDHLHLKEKQSVTVCSFDNNDALPAKNSQA